MKNQLRAVGVDIGSSTIAVAEVDLNLSVLKTYYKFHRGNIRKTLEEILKNIKAEETLGVSYTASSPPILKHSFSYDTQLSIIEAAKEFVDKIGTILLVGAEKFGLIIFDQEDNYRKLRTNSSCAAGTGSFLDQQARRLNLKDSGELSKIALSNSGEIPHIASRCAVFAKTDLIHAQQEGYSLESICDGLCLGLANNIVDTLFSGESPVPPILMAGGVSLNRAVVKHLERLLNTKIIIHPYSHVFGAIGAAILFLRDRTTKEPTVEKGGKNRSIETLNELIVEEKKKKEYFYKPLELTLSSYPDFTSEESYKYTPRFSPMRNSKQKILDNPVEVDIYTPIRRGNTYSVYMGIDIGSTSTKSILLGENNEVIAGFYTRTAGKPLLAVQAIFEAIDDIRKKKEINLLFRGVGTTGSGRKFIGQIIGADLILDEITAHAKAAYHLDPEIDTIIEIGGQDAKFTTMRNGMVTFSQMNTVCAAGTGSFIEEQATRLNCPLSEYAQRASGVPSPLASDRCTVFMERDINNYLNQDYSVSEILAAALFSVRENYLQKVANEASIGNKICFQGATAKNKALVAAFEQKLKKPIFVSKYCHLTGAMGVALLMAEGELTDRKLTREERENYISSFRGIDLYRDNIPIETEICNLCNNHCRIRVATVKGEKVAYGFLCGRDYDVKKFVNRNKTGFDLIKERKKLFKLPATTDISGDISLLKQNPIHKNLKKLNLKPIGNTLAETISKYINKKLPREELNGITVGIPAGLHLFDDLPLWRYFFKKLSIKTITSEKLEDPIELGKPLTGAEFCAPMTALHGHVKYLAERADYIFLPYYLQSRDTQAQNENQAQREKRLYCYYTQFSPALVSRIEEGLEKRCIMPLMNHLGNLNHSKEQLFKALNETIGNYFTYQEIDEAFEEALEWYEMRKQELAEIYEREIKNVKEFAVVLVGRPYTILSPAMNKGIPDIFNALGVKTFYQDMIPHGRDSIEDINPLVRAMHWHYASKILEVTRVVAENDKLFPVLITSFKCSPDSFVIEYFKRIMDSREKPYLILQIDEHDSNVGYETRIEAGIRAFRNYLYSKKTTKAKQTFNLKLPINPTVSEKINGKTLLFPNWDPLSLPFIVANLRREGIDARLIKETPLSIQKGVKLNTNQCIPLNIIASEMIETIERENLKPENTLLWMPKTELPCNFMMYPFFIKSLLEAHSKEMGKAGVYYGDFTFSEVSIRATLNAYFAYMFGGLLRRLGCKIRPYEVNKGETDRTIEKSVKILERAFLGEISKDEALTEVMALFDKIERIAGNRPKVAIFGDLYVRDNEVFNQGLIYAVENAGGEVITTPYNEYVKIIAEAYFIKWWREVKYMDVIKNKPLLASIKLLEQRYYHYFEKFLGPMPQFNRGNPEEELKRFGILIEHTGESYDNILKIFHLLRTYPDISLFIQANPTFCCPSLITEAMARDIERLTGVPVLTITYDGTTEYKNTVIAPYIKYARTRNSSPKGELERRRFVS